MVSPTEIANMAFAPRADALNQTTQFYTQLAAQQQAQRASRELQDAKLTQDFNKDLLDRIAASGTPADELIINQSNEAINRIAQFNRENPRASRQQKEENARQIILPVIANKEIAKSAYEELKAREALTGKTAPYLNLSQYRKDFTKDLIYDEQGQPRQRLNMAALSNPNLDLTNIDVQEKYADDAALSPLMYKMYKEQLQPSEQTDKTTDKRIGQVDLTYKAIPEFQRLNADATKVEFNTMPIKVGDKVYETFPEGIGNPFENDPKFKIAQKRLVKTLKEENPSFNDAPESLVNSVAMTQLTKRYASGETTKVDRSYETQKTIDLERQRARQNARADEQLAMQREANLRNRDLHERKMKEEPFTPTGIWHKMVVGTIKDEGGNFQSTDAKADLINRYPAQFSEKVWTSIKNSLDNDTRKELIKLKNKNGNIPVSEIQKMIKFVDLSAANKGYFMDYNLMKKYKLIGAYDENADDLKMVRVYEEESVTDDKTGVIKVIPAKIVPVKKNANEILYIEDQMKGTPQKIKETVLEPIVNQSINAPSEEN
jgi:hypothetical protein